MKYTTPSNPPAATIDFQVWVLDELRHLSDILSEVETDSILLKQWNTEPNKVYDGLIVYADGTNWDPGSGEGYYGYYNATWNKLG